MISENLRNKFFTSNFIIISKNIFSIPYDLNNNIDINNKENLSAKIIPFDFQNNLLENIKLNISNLFKNLLYELILENETDIGIDLDNKNNNNKHNENKEDKFDFKKFNNRYNILKIIEITQFLEISLKIYKIPIIYSCIFENILWAEFSNYDKEPKKRRIILILISILFKLFLQEDNKLIFNETKIFMNWLYAIIDPQFDRNIKYNKFINIFYIFFYFLKYFVIF
jgi:hypothetical protein